MLDLFGLTFARPGALWLLLLAPAVLLSARLFGARAQALPRSVVWLRAATVVLLALTLAEPLVAAGGGASSTVFVVDRSRSLTDATDAQVIAWIDEALAEADSGDRAAIVSFASSPVLAAPAGPASGLGGGWHDIPATLDQEFTDIESALALARALPLGGARRIVLVSDGAENIGSALNQAGQAATDGTPIDVLPVSGVGDSDLRVEAATAPSAVWAGESVTVVATIASNASGQGVVQLLVDGEPYDPRTVTIPAGLSSYTFVVDDLDPGFHRLEANVSGAGDRFPGNNVAPLALVVRDQPNLLLVAPAGTDIDRLRSALERRDDPESGGATVTVVEPMNLPSRLSDLGVYDAIILNNVPADALTFDQLAALQEVTRSLGRGLVVLGGGLSYGPGGYAGTLLEEALPVTVKVTDGRERQRIALLLIIDKSGSMSYDPLGGTSKIEMAKEAARLAVSAVADGDQIGILVFNDQQQWIQTMTTIEGDATREEINAAIDGLVSDGGTEIYPALSIGFDAIRRTDADVRHIVLLSDGKSRTGTRDSYQRLIDDVIGDRTTLSTIAIGDDADTDLLQFLAEQGNGRYHFTEKAEDIPRLTMAEAQSAGSQSVIRGTFTAIHQNPSPIMDDFDPQDLPGIDGYDFAEPKAAAQVILTSPRDDPILAKWQYGLGRVVAWTADDGADFAPEWTGWPRYAEFWANVVRWSLPDPENRPIQVSVEREGPEARITVDAVGEQGDYVDQARTTARIIAPSGAVTEDVVFYQSGPGRYEVRVDAPESGAYEIEVTQDRGGEPLVETAGFAIAPSPELQPAPDAPALLQTLAARTGGRVLSLDDPGMAFDRGGLEGAPLPDYTAVWYIPLAAALALFLTELAIRLQFLQRLQGFLGRGRAV